MRTCYWPRAIIHVHIHALLASIEQRDFPELRGQPVGVTHGVGTRPIDALLDCSHEARAAGVKVGMDLQQARRLCPNIIQQPARPQAYAAVSTLLMGVLAEISPDVEISGVDQAYIDVTHRQDLHGSPEHMAHRVKDCMDKATHGLPCSVGLAGDKSTAKVASGMCKPDGLTVIPPWEARARLRPVPMENICCTLPRIHAFLQQYGARTCEDVAAMPVNLLVRRYGVVGKQVWLMCQGRDTTSIMQEVAPSQSLGQGKVLPPHTTSRRTLLTYMRHMCEKLATRLRRYDMQAGGLYIELRYGPGEATNISSTTHGIAETLVLPYAAPHGQDYFARAQGFMEQHWQGEPITHMHVTATHLRNASGQLELFSADEVRAFQCFNMIDRPRISMLM